MTDQRSILRRRCAPVVSAFAWLLLACVALFGFSGAAHATDGEPCPGMPTVTDADGNVYPTVRIGSQCWMGEDLRTTRFDNGSSIPSAQPRERWITRRLAPSQTSFTLANSVLRLYNFAAVRTNNICPAGWRVPSKRHWERLRDHLGSEVAGSRLKSTILQAPMVFGWKSPNQADNTSGFGGLPAGMRTSQGVYQRQYSLAYWWSSDSAAGQQAIFVSASHDSTSLSINSQDVGAGFSVRCLRTQAVAEPAPPIQPPPLMPGGHHRAGGADRYKSGPCERADRLGWRCRSDQPGHRLGDVAESHACGQFYERPRPRRRLQGQPAGSVLRDDLSRAGLRHQQRGHLLWSLRAAHDSVAAARLPGRDDHGGRSGRPGLG